MESYKFYQYSQAMKPIIAHETLTGINVSMYPHLKKDKRSEVFRRLKREVQTAFNKGKGLLGYATVKENIMRQLKNGR